LLVPVIIVSALIVSIVVRKLNLTLFDKTYSYYAVFAHLKYAKWLMLLDIAVYPAIFEELGFRGFLFTNLNRYTGLRGSVIISSAAFSIMHISLISFFWLFPFSLLLGYLRARYNTIWYGVAVHFIFNATACIYDMHLYRDYLFL
jgi:membrane protease YdiL (CAAX protease family)